MKKNEYPRLFEAKLHIEGEGPLPRLHRQVCEAVITESNLATQKILRELLASLDIGNDDKGFLFADLLIRKKASEVEGDYLARARGNIAGNPHRKQKVTESEPAQKSTWQMMKPYSNSYRLMSLTEEDGMHVLRFRLLERTLFRHEKTMEIREQFAPAITAKFLQGLIISWMRPDLSDIPKRQRAGPCQAAAEQVLSHIGLLSGTDQEASRPSLLERHPALRRTEWYAALERIAKKRTPFVQSRARDIEPGKYADDDPKGDRLRITDSDWITFIKSPFPGRMPADFVTSNAIVVFKRIWTEGKRERSRCYAMLPLLEGVREDSVLGRLAKEPKLFWWQNHRDEFTALASWEQSLPKENTAIVVPLEYDIDSRDNRFESAFTDSERRVCCASLVEKRMQRSEHYALGADGKPYRMSGRRLRQKKSRRAQLPFSRSGSDYYIQIATAKEVMPIERPFILGIHFQVSPVISWVLMDLAGNVKERGKIEGNAILDEALAQKTHLEEAQGKLRWVGGREFEQQIKQRTSLVAHAILRLAQEKNANIALEEIVWVQKSSGNAEANTRFSLWNYSKLATMIAWLGMERYSPPISLVAKVRDFISTFTCLCGACRKKGQDKETADTFLLWVPAGSILKPMASEEIYIALDGFQIFACRKCEFMGQTLPTHKAEVIVRFGLNVLLKKNARQEQEL